MMNGRRLLISKVPANAIMCEVGTWRGNFAAEMLEWAKPSELHLIDPWNFNLPGEKKFFIPNTRMCPNQDAFDAMYAKVVDRFKDKPEVIIHRAKSQDIASTFPDGYFDFVYIDGDHSYEQTLLDFELFWPKVSIGGIISSDDESWGEEYKFPVRRAIKFFIDKYNISEATTNDNQWWTIKSHA
jgi:hypothetical protein